MAALPHTRRAPARALRSVAGAATHALLTVGCVAVAAVLFWAVASQPMGYRILVDQSDSMRPAIAAGDVLITRLAPPGEVRVGEIVTFQDPQRRGRLLTHRVVSKKLGGTGYAFVTRGDANTGVERWSIADDGQVGRLTGRVPKVGLAMAWLRDGPRRAVLLLLTSLALIALLARIVWRL